MSSTAPSDCTTLWPPCVPGIFRHLAAKYIAALVPALYFRAALEQPQHLLPKQILLARLQEFCEDCEGQKKFIQRSTELQSNAELPAAFERATGDQIYNGLLSGFRVRA